MVPYGPRHRETYEESTAVPRIDTYAHSLTCTDSTSPYWWSGSGAGGKQTQRFKSIDDVVTKDYFKRRQAGEWIWNPLTIHTWEKSCQGTSSWEVVGLNTSCSQPGNVRYPHFPGYGSYMAYRYSGWPVLNGIITDGAKTDLQNEVWTRCLAGRQSGNANILESLAESDQAFRMLVSPLENVRRFADGFAAGVPRHRKRGIIRHGLQFWQFASAEWLRYRYGIRPLIGDVQAALKVFGKEYPPEPTVHRSKAKGVLVGNSAVASSLNDGVARLHFNTVTTHTVSVSAVFYDRYQSKPATDMGVSLHNLIGLPWELMGYSFVIDWFVNVGDFIYASLPRPGVTAIGGCYTTRDLKEVEVIPTSLESSHASYSVTGSISDTFKVNDDVKIRSVNLGGPVLVIKPNFKLTHWVRALDAATLASQALRRLSFK